MTVAVSSTGEAMNSLSRWLRFVGVATLALAGASGCGLSDYQARMDAQRVRIQRFDDTNNLLDSPIEMPANPDQKPAWPFDFYLRLPKGYVLHKTPYSTNFAFYRYYTFEPGYNIFLAAALISPPKAKEMLGVYTLENFRGYVRLGIDDYYFKNYKADANFFLNKTKLFLPADKLQYVTIEEPAHSPFSDVTTKISYSYVVFKDMANKQLKEHSEFRAYFHESGHKQVAIVVQCPLRGSNEAFDKSIKASLSTLDVSAEAISKREQFKKIKGS
jgi:hypothetical protein